MSFVTFAPRQIFQQLLVCFLFTCLLPAETEAALQEKKSKQSKRRTAPREDVEDYFRKWLNQDVVHIISEEERKVFERLSTAEEKEQFIEQFWFRRDPDPRSAANEFKQEHYRRIVYANEMFSSGIPGWLTDQGRIYIIHGPPAEIQSHPTGGNYHRPHYEGGGTTSTYPFEVWRYRYIEGMGTDIVIEFVDPTLSGEQDKGVIFHGQRCLWSGFRHELPGFSGSDCRNDVVVYKIKKASVVSEALSRRSGNT